MRCSTTQLKGPTCRRTIRLLLLTPVSPVTRFKNKKRRVNILRTWLRLGVFISVDGTTYFVVAQILFFFLIKHTSYDHVAFGLPSVASSVNFEEKNKSFCFFFVCRADREVMIQNARPVNTADNSRLVDNEITGTADPNNPFSGPMKTVP